MAAAIGCGSLFAQYRYTSPPDSVRYLTPDRDEFVIGGDTVHLQFIADAEAATSLRSLTLTERDYQEVAAELGVEVAAIKAVVEIEAGKAHQGFWKPGHPIINFDMSVFRQMAARHKVNLSGAQNRYPVVFNRPNISKYGSQQAAVQARVDAAMAIDTVCAIEGITSPDGRVFGKMGHSERIGYGLYQNVPGVFDMKMFQSAVNYFKKQD